MYRREEIKNKITVADYMENYKNMEGFLDYCEKCMGYRQVWSCPLYDFNPEGFGNNFKYFYLMGTKIILNEDSDAESKKSSEYINQICLEEKYILTKKVQALEKKHPGSVGMITGNCHMCTQCSRPLGEGCRYSDEIRFFLESIGADVGKTAGEFLGIKLQLMKQKQPEYFTLLSGLLTDDPKVEI